MRISLLLLTVLLIATAVKGEKPLSDMTATNAGQGRLEPLFTAVLQYQSDSLKSAVVPSEGREGAFIGTSDGTLSGTQSAGRSERRSGRVTASIHWCVQANQSQRGCTFVR